MKKIIIRLLYVIISGYLASFMITKYSFPNWWSIPTVIFTIFTVIVIFAYNISKLIEEN